MNGQEAILIDQSAAGTIETFLSMLGNIYALGVKQAQGGAMKTWHLMKFKKANKQAAEFYNATMKDKPQELQMLISVLMSIWREEITADSLASGIDETVAKNIVAGVKHFINHLSEEQRAHWNKVYAERGIRVEFEGDKA